MSQSMLFFVAATLANLIHIYTFTTALPQTLWCFNAIVVNNIVVQHK